MTVSRRTLPDAPKVELESLNESRIGEGGFLILRRTQLRTITGGEVSGAFPYDVVDRRSIDASVMLAHHRDAEGGVWVWLRSSMRPAIALRGPVPEGSPVMWEVPAGLIDDGETPIAAAVREIAEELGFAVTESMLAPLGPRAFPAAGFIGEYHHFFHVEVDPTTRTEPEGDGSLVEAGAEVICVPLGEALAACRRGEIPDEKTELALRRLAEIVA